MNLKAIRTEALAQLPRCPRCQGPWSGVNEFYVSCNPCRFEYGFHPRGGDRRLYFDDHIVIWVPQRNLCAIMRRSGTFQNATFIPWAYYTITKEEINKALFSRRIVIKNDTVEVKQL